MPKSPNDRLQGTLDLLILKALARSGPLHGYAIAKRIHEEKWLSAEWGLTESKRQARFYKLTALGRKQLEREEENWDRLTAAVARVLRPA
ncbi:MAG: PadR family transcriptional regulator [Candidatus Acidiferrales bacterium]